MAWHGNDGLECVKDIFFIPIKRNKIARKCSINVEQHSTSWNAPFQWFIIKCTLIHEPWIPTWCELWKAINSQKNGNFSFASPAFDVTLERQLCMHEIEDFLEFWRLLWLLGTFEYYVIYLLQQCFFRCALFSCTFPRWLCGALTRIDSTLRNRFFCFQKLSVHFLISNIIRIECAKTKVKTKAQNMFFFLLMLRWKKKFLCQDMVVLWFWHMTTNHRYRQNNHHRIFSWLLQLWFVIFFLLLRSQSKANKCWIVEYCCRMCRCLCRFPVCAFIQDYK